jgi:hypothetical protein
LAALININPILEDTKCVPDNVPSISFMKEASEGLKFDIFDEI